MDVNEVLQKSLIMRDVKIQIPMPAGAALPAQAPQTPAPAQGRPDAISGTSVSNR